MNKHVNDHYSDQYNEGLCHRDPFGIIQEIRTRELISRYLEKDVMSILEVGGANEVYSFFLDVVAIKSVTTQIWMLPEIEVLNNFEQFGGIKLNKGNSDLTFPRFSFVTFRNM